MGLIMEKQIKTYNIILAIAVFIGLPILFWALGDFPQRSNLNEAISIITLLSFSLMIGQFFLARSNKQILKAHKMSMIVKYHKYIGYIFISILLVHPFLIVIPRYFEAGVEPIDAFITIITSFNSTGIIFGIIAWGCMLLLGLTSFFRNHLGLTYKTWRVFHGISSIIFIGVALLHVIDLGRHSDTLFSIFFISLSAIGILLLLKTYFVKTSGGTK